ncbi:MAG: hypothetical protein JST54_27880 [Deltaproteobacteria bacterium]|nr:hypothetical protein [Deltaproteobacteria bacterium]
MSTHPDVFCPHGRHVYSLAGAKIDFSPESAWLESKCANGPILLDALRTAAAADGMDARRLQAVASLDPDLEFLQANAYREAQVRLKADDGQAA